MSIPFENRLQHLSPEERNNPQLVFENFFESFHLHEAMDMVEQVRKVMNASLHNKGQRERENWQYFFDKVEMLMEGAWLKRHV